MASSTPLLTNLSNVHCKSVLFTKGNRIFGLVQLNGRNLVAKPPAKISAFRYVTWIMPYTINSFLFKQVWTNILL